MPARSTARWRSPATPCQRYSSGRAAVTASRASSAAAPPGAWRGMARRQPRRVVRDWLRGLFGSRIDRILPDPAVVVTDWGHQPAHARILCVCPARRLRCPRRTGPAARRRPPGIRGARPCTRPWPELSPAPSLPESGRLRWLVASPRRLSRRTLPIASRPASLPGEGDPMAHAMTPAAAAPCHPAQQPAGRSRRLAGPSRSGAACFRMAHRLGLHEGICNHFSAMLPGSDSLFLVNPLWLGVRRDHGQPPAGLRF